VSESDPDGAESPYAALEAQPGIRRAVDEFYRRIAADPALAGYFDGVDMDRLRRHQVELLAAVVDGRRYAGRSMADAHRGLRITHAAFDRVLGHLNAALVDVGTDDRTIATVLRTVAEMRSDVVEG
jgi:hemoglobin